jgi:hypothetical protein
MKSEILNNNINTIRMEFTKEEFLAWAEKVYDNNSQLLADVTYKSYRTSIATEIRKGIVEHVQSIASDTAISSLDYIEFIIPLIKQSPSARIMGLVLSDNYIGTGEFDSWTEKIFSEILCTPNYNVSFQSGALYLQIWNTAKGTDLLPSWNVVVEIAKNVSITRSVLIEK